MRGLLAIAAALGLVLLADGLWLERERVARLMLRACASSLYGIGRAAGELVKAAVRSWAWSRAAVAVGFEDAVPRLAEPDEENVMDFPPRPPRRIRNG